MAKRRAKKIVKKSHSSPGGEENDLETKASQAEKRESELADQDVERQSIAIRATRDMEIERLLTELRLLRSYFNKEQLQSLLLQFVEENLPNLSVAASGRKGEIEMQWFEKAGNLPKKPPEGIDAHTSLLHRLSIVYPRCSSAMPSLSSFQLSNKRGETSHLGSHNLQIQDFTLEEPFDPLIPGIPVGLQTPGVSNQRMSIGMTPKTLRLPKPGEMLLSVCGSPLGVFKEDNMEAIQESEED